MLMRMIPVHRFAVLVIFVASVISTFKSNQFDLTGKLVNVAIYAAVCIAVVLLYERIKGRRDA